MLTRKNFLKRTALSAGAIMAGPYIADAAEYFNPLKLTVLHTNDTHSQLLPFPMDGGRNQGLGRHSWQGQNSYKTLGTKKSMFCYWMRVIFFRALLILICYKGEPEIKAMAAMNYDAATIGNHDFDAGMENLATQLNSHANFPMLICNYDFSGSTPMEYKTQPYKIFKKGKLKIGVFGIGIERKGLIPENLFGATKYLDPIQKANEVAEQFKKEKRM